MRRFLAALGVSVAVSFSAFAPASAASPIASGYDVVRGPMGFFPAIDFVTWASAVPSDGTGAVYLVLESSSPNYYAVKPVAVAGAPFAPCLSNKVRVFEDAGSGMVNTGCKTPTAWRQLGDTSVVGPWLLAYLAANPGVPADDAVEMFWTDGVPEIGTWAPGYPSECEPGWILVYSDLSGQDLCYSRTTGALWEPTAAQREVGWVPAVQPVWNGSAWSSAVGVAPSTLPAYPPGAGAPAVDTSTASGVLDAAIGTVADTAKESGKVALPIGVGLVALGAGWLAFLRFVG